MIQLIYTSDFCTALKPKDFKDILQTALAKNISLEITGMMVVIDEHIFQAIEGPEHNVVSLMDSIKTDSRHKNVRIIGTMPIMERDFPDWTMGFTSHWQGTQLDDVKSVLLQLTANSTFNEQHANSLRMLMRSLRPSLT
ncbi:BLUF domain-containing protein [Alteromonadaceae bacterium BrNp21-10]|nr:BLUF domain-containing protein [Alteromonadaceae bacterium BrNp21-10]